MVLEATRHWPNVCFVDCRVILAYDEILNIDRYSRISFSLKFLARLDRDPIDYWFTEIDRCADPALHLFIALEYASFVTTDERALIIACHQLLFVLIAIETHFFLCLLFSVVVVILQSLVLNLTFRHELTIARTFPAAFRYDLIDSS